jgi:hypothetical protein
MFDVSVCGESSAILIEFHSGFSFGDRFLVALALCPLSEISGALS